MDLETKISDLEFKIPSSTETPQRVINAESKIEEVEGHIDLLKSDLHRLNLSFARWEKQLTDEKDEMNAKKKERLKLLEEMLNNLEENLRINLEDTEDLKNREEQLELLIGKHHETLIAHNRRMNSLKPQAQPIPTPNSPGFGQITEVIVTAETDELDNNKTSGSNETTTNENDPVATENLAATTGTSVHMTPPNVETTEPSFQVVTEDTESHNDDDEEASDEENLGPIILEVDDISGGLSASTEPVPISNLQPEMDTITVPETETIQDSSLESTMSNAFEQSLEEDLEDDSKHDLNEDLEDHSDEDMQQDFNENDLEEDLENDLDDDLGEDLEEALEEDLDDDLEEALEEDLDDDPEEYLEGNLEKDREEDREEDLQKDYIDGQDKSSDEDPGDNKQDFEDLKVVATENQEGSLEGNEEQSV